MNYFSSTSGGDVSVIQASADAELQQSIEVSFFNSFFDNEPKQRQMTLQQLVHKLTKHEIRANKNGPSFSPAVYPEGVTRANNNAVYVTALVLDVDDGTPYNKLKDKFAPFAHVYYTSYRHTSEHAKYRVVIFLSEPILADEWAEFWHRANQYFEHMDPATKDSSRLYALPVRPEGGIYEAMYSPGKLLSRADLPELLPGT